jgi:hypothetical protein
MLSNLNLHLLIVADSNINSFTTLEQNMGIAKPRGIKVKEKTVQGSKRPVGGLEKAKPKRKNKVDDYVELQPHGTSTV